MNQIQIFEKLKSFEERADFFSYFVKATTAAGSPRYSIVKLPELRHALEEVRELPYLKEIAEAMIATEAIRNSYNDIFLDNSTFSRLSSLAAQLDTGKVALRSLLEYLGVHGEGGESLYVKLGQSENLTTVSELLGIFDQAVSQGLSSLGISSEMRAVRWESGSLWITISCSAVGAAAAIGLLAWAAACAFKKYNEALVVREMMRGVGIKNDAIEGIAESLNHAIEELIESESTALFERYPERASDPEARKRLRFAIKELYGMMVKGTEIHPALSAPEEVRNLFPAFGEISKLLLNGQKLLRSGEKGDGSE